MNLQVGGTWRNVLENELNWKYSNSGWGCQRFASFDDTLGNVMYIFLLHATYDWIK